MIQHRLGIFMEIIMKWRMLIKIMRFVLFLYGCDIYMYMKEINIGNTI
jgi:hypothetical protein